MHPPFAYRRGNAGLPRIEAPSSQAAPNEGQAYFASAIGDRSHAWKAGWNPISPE